MKFRVAYVVSHPIQYQAPLLRRIAATDDIDLRVHFISSHTEGKFRDPGFARDIEWDVPLLDGYDSSVLPAVRTVPPKGFFSPWSTGLAKALEGADAVWVHGWAHNAHVRAIARARTRGVKVLLRAETHNLGPDDRRVLPVVKRVAMPAFFRLIDGFLAIGTANRNFYFSHGVRPDRVFDMPYAVDNDFFRTAADEASTTRAALRAHLQIPDGHPIVLFAGKIQAIKRPFDLVQAHAVVTRISVGPEPYLVFAGDGPERRAVEAECAALGLRNVRFAGFQPQRELPRFYDLCTVLVLPSESETWGLVLNEVMNAGRPVVATNVVGAVPDLVIEGQTGFAVPPRRPEELADRIHRIVSDRTLAARMGGEARGHITHWNFDRDIEGLRRALASVCRPETEEGPRCRGPLP